jgi:hypothetical protein
MRNRAPIDFLLIIIVFLICGGLIFSMIQFRWYLDLGVQMTTDPETRKVMTPDKFDDVYGFWCYVVAGVSLLCAFAWYVLGEWGPRANQLGSSTWMFIWLALLVVAIGIGVTAVFLGPEVGENAWILTLSYFLFGVGPFLVATVLFSPLNTKYIPPGSSLVRRGW